MPPVHTSGSEKYFTAVHCFSQVKEIDVNVLEGQEYNKEVTDQNLTSRDEIILRHRTERKSLQAQLQMAKRVNSKDDKRKRKELIESIMNAEKELNSRHHNELLIFDKKIEPETVSDVIDEYDDVSEVINVAPQQYDQRVSKAQRRRNKKEIEQRERQQKIATETTADTINSPRNHEEQKIRHILAAKQLQTYLIPSDGNCLFNAVIHQLNMHGYNQANLKITDLRNLTSDYLIKHKNDLLPYLEHPNADRCLNDSEFDEYCLKIRSTPAWGGHVEIRALAAILSVRIVVLQAAGVPTVCCGNMDNDKTLTITYHRHIYSLGEHYNSTMPTK